MADSPGRPRAIQGPVEERLLQALEAGSPIRLACAYAGCAPSTYFATCNADAEFAERATRARASAAMRNLALLQQAAPSDWRAAAKALELMFPEDFNRGRVELTGVEGGPVRIAPEVSPDFVADVLRRLGETGSRAAEEDPG